jgi:hypothetical protein
MRASDATATTRASVNQRPSINRPVRFPPERPPVTKLSPKLA